MNIVGLITEYNPFHNGHYYHLNKSKEITGCDYSVAVMSGNFLQRGEPALLDKWTRAQMAIDNGVDLVVELPTIYACQSAEYFAYGAVAILDSLNVITNLSFGSELGELDGIKKVSDILFKEPSQFKKYLKEHLDRGLPFPRARSEALKEYIIKKDITINNLEDILSNPNNILGIEYLKSLRKLDSKITPQTIKRRGAHYNSTEIEGVISSATSIRREYFKNRSLLNIKKTVSKKTYEILANSQEKYYSFNRLKNYEEILLYLLRTTPRENLMKILDIEEGLENRIIRCSEKFNTIKEILNCVSTKRYTLTRLQRILIHLLLGIEEDTFTYFHKNGPLYIRVLGFNNKGITILNRAKKVSKLPIITKYANYNKYPSKDLHRMIEYDKKATDIYFLGLKEYKGNKSNLDYLISPYKK